MFNQNKKIIIAFIFAVLLMPKQAYAVFDTAKTTYCSYSAGDYELQAAPTLKNSEKSIFQVSTHQTLNKNSGQHIDAGANEFHYWAVSAGAVEKLFTIEKGKITKCPTLCYVKTSTGMDAAFQETGKNCTDTLAGILKTVGHTAEGDVKTVGGSAKNNNPASDESSTGADVGTSTDKPDINNIFDGENVEVSCNGIFSTEAINLVDELLMYVQILGPVALIILTAADMGKAVMAQDEKELAKASGKVLKRVIATLALFLAPTIVRIILGLDGVQNFLVSSKDPLCRDATGTDSGDGGDYWSGDGSGKTTGTGGKKDEDTGSTDGGDNGVSQNGYSYCVYNSFEIWISKEGNSNVKFIEGSINVDSHLKKDLHGKDAFASCPNLYYLEKSQTLYTLDINAAIDKNWGYKSGVDTSAYKVYEGKKAHWKENIMQ